MKKLRYAILVGIILFFTNPGERAHQNAIAGDASFLGDFAALIVSSKADYVNLGLFSVTVSKQSAEMLSFGILGQVIRL